MPLLLSELWSHPQIMFSYIHIKLFHVELTHSNLSKILKPVIKHCRVNIPIKYLYP